MGLSIKILPENAVGTVDEGIMPGPPFPHVPPAPPLAAAIGDRVGDTNGDLFAFLPV